jgi:hypothetical protein
MGLCGGHLIGASGSSTCECSGRCLLNGKCNAAQTKQEQASDLRHSRPLHPPCNCRQTKAAAVPTRPGRSQGRWARQGWRRRKGKRGA